MGHPSGDLVSWLPLLRRRLGPELANDPAFARLQNLRCRLSPRALGVLEVRLAPDLPPEREAVDLALRLRPGAPPEDLPEADRGRRPGAWMPPHLAEFLSRWTVSGEEGRVPSVWLELDLDPAPAVPSAPGVYAELCDADPAWLTEELFPRLRGTALSAAERFWVHRCAGRLPAGARLLYAASMLSRTGSRCRLEIAGLSASGLAAYAAEVLDHPWVGEAAALFADCDKRTLAFDVGEAVSPRIGIAGSWFRSPRREPRWAGLLSELVERGLCAAAKREALLGWSGSDSLWTAGRDWPAELGGGFHLARSLSHLKLVAWPDRPPEAKAYLAFQPFSPPSRSGDG